MIAPDAGLLTWGPQRIVMNRKSYCDARMTAKVLLVLLLGLFLSLFVPGLAQAQPSDEVIQMSKELYCPLCTGLRLDACDLPLCNQMREVIHQKLAAGETKEQIKAHFVEQYGQVVLGVPPKQGSAILAWVLPFLVLLVAGGWMYRLVRRWIQQRAPEEAEVPASQPLPAEYVERLERELEQLE